MDIFLKIRVTKEFREKIKKLCEVKNKNFSQIVREFLEKEFKKNKIK